MRWVLKPFRGDEGRKTEVNFSCDGISLCQAKWALIGGMYGPAHVGFSTRTHTYTLTQSPHCHLLSSELSTELLISASRVLTTFLSFFAPVCVSPLAVLTGSHTSESDQHSNVRVRTVQLTTLGT